MVEAGAKPHAISEKQVYRIVINAPIETVWNTLVKTDEALPFFFGSVCRTTGPALGAGQPYAMRSPDGKFTSVVGQVLEFNPPFLYKHTLQFTNNDDPACTVSYVLKEVPGGTEFSLITENVPTGTKMEKGMVQSTNYILRNVKSVAETGKATFGGSLMLAMISLMTPMMPRQCRSEHWPLEN
jgi:uncharacterized protein YndB with AHSA1/START domain